MSSSSSTSHALWVAEFEYLKNVMNPLYRSFDKHGSKEDKANRKHFKKLYKWLKCELKGTGGHHDRKGQHAGVKSAPKAENQDMKAIREGIEKLKPTERVAALKANLTKPAM